MITCSKCGDRVGVTGPCKACAKLRKALTPEQFAAWKRMVDDAGREALQKEFSHGTGPANVGLSALINKAKS